MPAPTNKRRGFYSQKPTDEYTEKVIQIKRVSKKTKGGNQSSFTALTVVGDKKGKIGIGFGRAKDVSSAIKKAIRKAKADTTQITIVEDTIPAEIKLKYKSAIILLKPAKKGTGIIAGGPIRSLIQVSGIKNIASKIMGSRNKILNVRAAQKALQIISNA